MAKESPEPETGAAPSRLCFVIMPFSATSSCTEDEWTYIFETVIRPAVENAGLSYECRRSTATRGNIVAAIVEALRDAYVVIADLTDQNPNVFYELGVRHTMKNRTILIAQNEEFIPFDLRPYAYHIYHWKTAKGKRQLAAKLCELLADVDQSPERSDNPVSDFLKGGPEVPVPLQVISPPPRITPAPRKSASGAAGEPLVARSLAGTRGKSFDALELGRTLARRHDAPSVRAIVLETRRFLSREWPRLMDKLNLEAPATPPVPKDQTYAHCLPYIQRFSPDAERVEQFGLALVAAAYRDGLAETLRILQDWITLSQQYRSDRSLRAVRGAPSLLAFRVLATWAAKAADDMSLQVLGVLLTHPLDTTESSGQAATLSLVERHDLFWPEGLFGWADLAVRYLREEPWKNSHVANMFASQRDYLNGLSRFLFTAALIHDARYPEEPWPLYPGFKLIPGSSGVLTAFASRLRIEPRLVEPLAKMAKEDVATFKAKWPERARRLNDTPLGGGHDLFSNWKRIPEEI